MSHNTCQVRTLMIEGVQVSPRTRRRNQSLLDWVRAAGVGVTTYLGLAGLGFGPGWGAVALALGAGALAIASADLGILLAVVALSLPMLATAPLVGIAFLVLGLVTLRYLGADGGRGFFIIALALVGAFFGPVWAAAALAGYLLGAAEGALAAAVSCLAVQGLGLVMGKEALSVVITGGTTALLDPAKTPEMLFSSAWVSDAVARLSEKSVDRTIAALTGAEHIGALVAQPLLWAGAAALVGGIVRTLRSSGHEGLAPLATIAGVAVPAAGTVVLAPLLDVETVTGDLAVAFVSSIVVAVGVAFVWDRIFRLEAVPEPIEAAARPATVAAEDADVDELLRLIATAEDKLSTEHTTTKIVMITDMKSFSRMTEEDGSMVTAKAIQRHRDLLMPIIEAHGGAGKSTGGDGLVAAFDAAGPALEAAAEMQRKLDAHNRAHPNERDLSIRIGVADGEVVLDKGGRPFIGNALNLAARVMNLADGGQAFTTSKLALAAGPSHTVHSHGSFQLKNIAEPVEVIEVIWYDGQVPVDPRQRLAPTE
jgi:class 3 adenylate cyclase